MKKILIALRDLQIGGIEKAAIELIRHLIEKECDVTLALEEKRGELIKQLDNKVKIIQYKPCTKKVFGKTINGFKRLIFILKYKNKYDISISYATYSKTCSFLARESSKTSILWCHADYLELFKKDEQKMRKFFEEIYYDDFFKIVFVSKSAKNTFLQVFPNQKNVYYCNNLINSKKIYEMATETIDLKYNSGITTFLNVGRHDEKQKKLSRIIKSAILLKKEGYKFRIILVGNGPDTEIYKNMVEKYKLEKNIIFVGAKENPYPYYKITDCIVMSSDYEGYPVVFLESYVLNKPIITTNVSDYADIQNSRGIVTSKDEKEIYKAMKEFLNNGYKIKNKFDSIKYNAEMEKKIDEILKNS